MVKKKKRKNVLVPTFITTVRGGLGKIHSVHFYTFKASYRPSLVLTLFNSQTKAYSDLENYANE